MKKYNHSNLTIFDKETLALLHENANNARKEKLAKLQAMEAKKQKEEEIIAFILLCLIVLVFSCIGGLLTI